MPQFESGTLAVGFIFPYQNPVSKSRLDDWLDEKNFKLIEEESQRGLSIGPRGVEVEGEEGIAKRDDMRILYQPSANLNGFPNSSFLTAKNSEAVDFETVLGTVGNIKTWLDDEVDVLQDVATFESTIEGLVRTGRGYDLTEFFNSETLELVGAIGDHPAEGITARFESEADPDTNDWYRLLIDQDAVGNPNLWGTKIVTRYGQLSEISEDTVITPVDNLIGHTMGE
jgi:hypothetical protein